MKKILVLVLALMMVFSLCACGGSSSSAPAASSSAAAPAASETVVFKHGFDLDYPPYSYLQDDGSVGGFDVEVAQAVCAYLGWEYEAVPFNWDAKDAELNSGARDCIWSGFTVEGREDQYVWSMPYSSNTQMILVKADSGIASLADLSGKIVGVQTATSAYDLLEEDQAELCASFASLEVYETYTIAFNDLKAGAIDAIAIDATAGSFLTSGETGYAFLEENLGAESYAAGFRMGDEALRDQVNAALEALAADGTIAKIAANPDYAEIADYLTIG